MPAPFEMVSGPLTIYTATEGTAAPTIEIAPPTPTWTLLGANGDKSISDDGLTINFEEEINDQMVLGSTVAQKAFRVSEGVMFDFTLFDLTAEMFAIAMSGLPVTDVPAGTRVAAFTATPVPTVSGGSGSGATIASITVNADGAITDVTWTSGGTGYAVNDVITFTQGTVTGTYTLVAGDVTAGVLQNFTGKTIAGSAPTATYKTVPLVRGFNISYQAFLFRGFSPYLDNANAQYWLPKGYAQFSGEVQYQKGEAAGLGISVKAYEYGTFGLGQYQTQDALP